MHQSADPDHHSLPSHSESSTLYREKLVGPYECNLIFPALKIEFNSIEILQTPLMCHFSQKITVN